MARTFIRQSTQISPSGVYADDLSAGAALESGAASIEADLNALRSQLQRSLTNGAGKWYDDLFAPSDLDPGAKRATNELNDDLHDLERKRVLVSELLLAPITVEASGGSPVPSNYVILGAGELPTETTLALGAVTTLGTVAANNASFGTHSLDEVAGANALAPKNLCQVVDATTRDPILSSNRVVFALLQSESNTDGSTISASSPDRVQLSFVRLNSAGNDLEAVPVEDIGSKVINFAYVKRAAMEDLNEITFLRGAEVDNAGLSNINLQIAFDNQGDTPVDITASPTFDLAASTIMEWRDDAQATLLSVSSDTAGDDSKVLVTSAVDVFDSNAIDNDFENGMDVDSGGTLISIGKTANTIETTGANLKFYGNPMYLNDGNQNGSTWSSADGIALAASSAEWDAFEAAFGEVSLLDAIEQCLDQDNVRGTKAYYVVPSDVAPDTNIPTGVDMSAGDFVANYDVFLNGVLMQGGANSGVDNDYYEGSDKAAGDLKFEFDIKAGDVIAIVPFEAAQP